VVFPNSFEYVASNDTVIISVALIELPLPSFNCTVNVTIVLWFPPQPSANPYCELSDHDIHLLLGTSVDVGVGVDVLVGVGVAVEPSLVGVGVAVAPPGVGDGVGVGVGVGVEVLVGVGVGPQVVVDLDISAPLITVRVLFTAQTPPRGSTLAE
jgi:hypothetical protein